MVPAVLSLVLSTTGAVRQIPLNGQEWSLEWSPNGQTLAMIDIFSPEDGDSVKKSTFRLFNPTRTIELPVSDNGWAIDRWKPDGKQIMISDWYQTLILDMPSGKIAKRLPPNTYAWWIGDVLCITKKIEVKPNNRVHRWWFGKQERKLPTGLTFDSASLDGNVLIAEVNKGSNDNNRSTYALAMIVLDEAGNIRWYKKLLSGGRLDLRADYVSSWNPKYGMLARTVDISGAPSMLGFVEDRFGETALEALNIPNESWYGADNLRWVGERSLTMTMDVSYLNGATPPVYIALFDAVSKTIRPIYGSPSMVSYSGSKHSAAIIERQGSGSCRLVICGWKRNNKGEIITTEYVPADAPRDALGKTQDWSHYIIHPSKPLKPTRTRPAIVAR